MTANPRAARRNQLFLWGLLPALVLLLLAGRVGLLLRADAAGRAAYASGEYGAAQGRFEANRSLNVLEPWKAPFNAGTALYRDEELAAAVDAFEAALDAGPGRDECTVRINLALTHEAIGDAAAEADDEPASRDAWTAGREVLAAGDCPTDAGRGPEQSTVAATVDARLADELGDPPPEQQQPEDEGEGPAAGPRAAEEAEADRGAQPAGPGGSPGQQGPRRLPRRGVGRGLPVVSGQPATTAAASSTVSTRWTWSSIGRPRASFSSSGHAGTSSVQCARPTSTIGATADGSA